MSLATQSPSSFFFFLIFPAFFTLFHLFCSSFYSYFLLLFRFSYSLLLFLYSTAAELSFFLLQHAGLYLIVLIRNWQYNEWLFKTVTNTNTNDQIKNRKLKPQLRVHSTKIFYFLQMIRVTHSNLIKMQIPLRIMFVFFSFPVNCSHFSKYRAYTIWLTESERQTKQQQKNEFVLVNDILN